MFFFIGGLQPKIVELDGTPRLCPACGLAQARLKRVDQYLSLFFIPLFRVRKGEPVVICNRCGEHSTETGTTGHRPEDRGARCSGCGYPLGPGFNYCPQCGNRV